MGSGNRYEGKTDLPALLVHVDMHLVGIPRRPRDGYDTSALVLNRCGRVFTEELTQPINQRTAGHIRHVDLVLLILRHAVLLSTSTGYSLLSGEREFAHRQTWASDQSGAFMISLPRPERRWSHTAVVPHVRFPRLPRIPAKA